jgi:hypothetical protein
LRHYATGWDVAGLRPAKDIEIFKFTFQPHYALGFVQPLKEMSTKNRNKFLGNKARQAYKAQNFTLSMSRLYRQCGILNISQTYKPPRPVIGIFIFFYFYSIGIYPELNV